MSTMRDWMTVSGLSQKGAEMMSSAASLGTTVQVNTRSTSSGEAERKGKAALRRQNKHEISGSLTLMGDIRLVAGLTITLDRFSAFSGKYIIEKASHSVTSSGYVTKIDVRRVLEGY